MTDGESRFGKGRSTSFVADAEAEPRHGQVIFLNGASSSGKTSIAQELLPLLDRPYFLMSVDAVNAMRSHVAIPPDHLAQVLERTVLGFHRAVAGMAEAGNDIVVDHVLRERSWLIDCLDLLAPFDVVFVGVVCPLAELERREHERGDRAPGRAAHHFQRVHSHGTYDVTCDTSVLSSQQCAAKIMDVVTQPAHERAFSQLRALGIG